MRLDERSNILLHELSINPGIKNKDLQEKYSLSRRQIDHGIGKINEWLEVNSLPIIERTKQGFFIINPIIKTIFHEAKDVISKHIPTEKERTELIILLLLSRNEELSLLHFTAALNVSKNTVLSDLKIAQTIIDPYKLKINYSRKTGYSIEGEEFQKRKLLMSITYKIINISDGKTWFRDLTQITDQEIQYLYKRIESIENQLNLRFTDERVAAMPYVLSLVLRRIKQGKTINSFNIHYHELSDTKEYKAAENLLSDLEHIPTEERLFITLQLLTTNVTSSDLLTEDTIPELIQALDEMLFLFEKLACIELKDKEQLLNKILLHVKPAYYRIKYKLTIFNPLEETVSKEFKELNHLVKKSSKPLANLIGLEIPESESTYLTMLIGGWLTRQGDSIHNKTKALVVCPNGISVSKLLSNTLTELFPELVFMDSLSVREFQMYKIDYEIVFSPVFLETQKKLFIVNPFLSREDKYLLRKRVMEELHGYTPSELDWEHVIEIIGKHAQIKDKHTLLKELNQYFTGDELPKSYEHVQTERPNLYELITPETMTIKDSVISWEEAICIASQPLLENGSITPLYVKAMIEKQYDMNPYIVLGKDITIPHASPEDGVNKISMSLLRLSEGVEISNNHCIHLIFVIAAVDKEQHLRALLQLASLSECERDIKAIMNAKTKSEIQQILKQYLEE
ncbi:Transcriptional regulator ManR [Peribacillus simplex]|uniref:BglG family transcription antiterminator n=1 Tax=Peribacillus simplex TaxID=1478 RepID=UPI001D575085|nr:BglG family transcription antiterminator [Peribacillus simplex]CAH0303189.1 Transcriptional regulator ManR [Peribacillus simplex]